MYKYFSFRFLQSLSFFYSTQYLISMKNWNVGQFLVLDYYFAKLQHNIAYFRVPNFLDEGFLGKCPKRGGKMNNLYPSEEVRLLPELVGLYVCLSVNRYTQTTLPIFTERTGEVSHGPRKKWKTHVCKLASGLCSPSACLSTRLHKSRWVECYAEAYC